MEKKLYIVSNWDDDISIPIKITEEQAKAIEWFIEWADLNYGCDLPEHCCAKEIMKEQIINLLKEFCKKNNIYIDNKDRDRYLEECGYYGKEFELYSWEDIIYGNDLRILEYEIEHRIIELSADGDARESAWAIFETLSDDILCGDYSVDNKEIEKLVDNIQRILEG